MEQSFVKLRIAEAEKLRTKQVESAHYRPSPGFKLDKDGKYYLVRLEMEIEKIKKMIDEAERDSLQLVPEEALGKIRNAVGKAQLLINKKFKQFNELCRDNINGTSEADPDKKETKSSDLEGYWEMMYIQIEDVRSLFDDIEKLRASNWQVQEPVGGHMQVPNGTQASTTPQSKRKSGGKSPRSKAKSSPASNVDQEKVKREAKNRMAAARKMAKERQEQDAVKNTSSASSDFFDGTSSDLEISINGRMVVSSGEVDIYDCKLNDSFSLDESLNRSANSEHTIASPNHAGYDEWSSPVGGDPERADDILCCHGNNSDLNIVQLSGFTDQPDVVVTAPPDIVVTNQPPSPTQSL